jgi:hypothetical protein
MTGSQNFKEILEHLMGDRFRELLYHPVGFGRSIPQRGLAP